jgi:hypothetical protein
VGGTTLARGIGVAGALTLERLVRALGAPRLRGVARGAVTTALRGQRLIPAAPAWRAVRDLILRPAACCPDGGAHSRFLHGYLELIERAGGVAAIGEYLRAADPPAAAVRVEAFARIALLGILRHEVLGRWRDLTGAPPVVLTDAQIAPYPDCDRDCAGCYSRDDRGGATPSGAHLAWLVDEAAACGACAVHVAGKGEPFLDARRGAALLDVIAARPHLLFTVATHGLAITPELAARMGRLGNLLVLVSVDGPQPVHDARRGAGSFDRVQRALVLLARSGALFGYASLVAATTAPAVITPEFVRAQAAAGCVMGVYSRYFPLAAARWEELALGPVALAAYRAGLAEARRAAAIPLLDLDEMEAHTGCRARAGVSVYIDGVTGAVAPCIRVPFAPAACRLDPARGIGLAEVLRHPFFTAYRARPAHGSWCGADLGAELGYVQTALGAPSPRLAAYRDRARRAAREEVPS